MNSPLSEIQRNRLGAPYPDSDSHLWDELARIDQLVRAYTLYWRETVAASKPSHLWGMLHVSDQEVDSYLAAPFRRPDLVPPSLQPEVGEFVAAAARATELIEPRVEQTPPDTDLRLERLARLFALDRYDRDVLLILLLAEIDGRYRRLFGYLRDDASRERPSVELVQGILQTQGYGLAAARARFGERAPLRAHCLVTLARTGPEIEPLGVRSIAIDPRIVDFLLGVDALDARLDTIVRIESPRLGWDDLVLDDLQSARLRSIAELWRRRRAAGRGLALYCHGSPGAGRRATMTALCGATETPLVSVSVERAAKAAAEGTIAWSELVSLVYREAALRGAAVLWRDCESLPKEEALGTAWRRLIEEAERQATLSCFTGERLWHPSGCFRATPFVSFELPMPDYASRRRLWAKLLPPSTTLTDAVDRGALIDTLADAFHLTAGRIVDALATAEAQAIGRGPEDPRPTVDEIYEGCRVQSARHLVTFARRIKPCGARGFDSLVLAEPNLRQLCELQGRIRFRSRVRSGLGFEHKLALGRGTVALFCGSSGTGKTMAAELLARDQNIDLYKVKLSAIVSKYVGETEKNLDRLFSDAEDCNALIFFDESESLFGRRGEIKEARDRWANLETNYLLQRIEEYSGVVILATNMRQNIDEAFLRRFDIVVEFPFPNAELRARIWQGMFPRSLRRPPLAQIESLAKRFELPGGSIRNIVVDAAFRALTQADAKGGRAKPKITLGHLVISIAREYHKLGRPVTKVEFGDKLYAIAVSEAS